MRDFDTELHTYAWSWFALHAGQRLQMVNFWLVATAFMAAAFVQAHVSRLYVVAFGISLAGCLSSMAFMRLDARTRRLVHVGENALRSLEQKRTEDGADETHELIRAAEKKSRLSRFDSYRYLIQASSRDGRDVRLSGPLFAGRLAFWSTEEPGCQARATSPEMLSASESQGSERAVSLPAAFRIQVVSIAIR